MAEPGAALHGWLVIDKPVGTGSTQVVGAVKRALQSGGYAKVKVGHGGTLDPLASGVLPIALGEATKLAGRLLDGDKCYAFTVRFGEQTDTLDLEGQVVATSDVRPRRAQVEAVLAHFTGPIEQVPPAFSALKVNGERAYDLARAGEVVALASRKVVVHSLMLRHPGVGRDPYSQGDHDETFLARVSKGTYIRSLARDIALALGTVGHVTYLRRTRAGPFGLAGAISLDKLTELGHAHSLEQHLLSLRAGLDDIPALLLTPDQAGALRQGRVLAGIAADDGPAFALLNDVPVALVEVRDREVRVERGFNL
ncbi:tRNA pseudouridine(55) synthase TruB [Sphingomonas bacterium]|uniref:tRNA pseudouridine(55) synthase TruB n=1 Tax=Sphingomonas bacterium TaxID=1895847 RepID=UPI0015769464|nr:tRNA pseudouridine(55) synthase TruB [Sphingomonas bacterium]